MLEKNVCRQGQSQVCEPRLWEQLAISHPPVQPDCGIYSISRRMPKRARTSSPERLDHARPASSSSSASGAATTARIASRPRTRTGTGSEGQNKLRYKSKR